jgi:fibronectin type 3 domain-containing protein
MTTHPAENRILAVCMAATLAIGTPVLKADLKVTFNKGGDNTTPTGTITVNLGTTSAAMSNLTGGGLLKEPTVSGALPGLSGSFDIHFQALGTVADTFDASDFSGGAATGIHSSTNATWAVNSDINTTANNVPGQGIVFTFDFTNLVGASAINLKAVRWNNDGGGSRLSFRDEGTGTSTALHSGGGTNSSDQTITFSPVQEIDSADQVAFWSGGGGQKRLAEFTFSYIPAGIVPPTGLTASTNGVQVNLNWDDDLSGTLGFYTVKRSETQGGPYTQVATNVLTSDFIDTSVATGATYYYVVTATDTVAFQTANSNEVSSFVRIQPPTGLTRSQGDGVINLDWNDNTSGILDFYTVYRSESSGGPYTSLATNLATSGYSDTTAINGTTYYYVVTATDDVVAIESANSAQVSGTPFSPVAGTALYAHLDGSVSASVTSDGGGIVSVWADRAANGFNASNTGGAGTVFYPGGVQSATGLDTLDFGFTDFVAPATNAKSSLLWFTQAQQNAWLNFNDGAGAAAYSGFAVFAVVQPDTILGGANRDVVLSSTETAFALRYEGGRPQMRLGSSTVLQGTAGAAKAGETVVLAVNYNATTGLLELWDSSSGNTSSTTVPAGNFANSAPVFLGGSVNSDQYMKGFIGEVKIFRGAMTPSEFSTERSTLGFKWSGLQTPSGLVASSGDGNVTLDWNDQVADFFTVYRGTETGSYTQLATGLTTSSFFDNTVIAGTTYYYVVSATKDSVESLQSAEVPVTPYTSIPGTTLIAHLDGSNSGNVTADENKIVSLWSDLTANDRDASGTGGVGTVFYPGRDRTESGLDGVEFGFTDFVAPANNAKSALLWFDAAGQDSWLNFNDVFGAKPYSGFAVFAVVHPNAILAGINRDVVMGSTENFFSIRYENGRPQVRLGPGASPTVLQGTAGAAKAGETLAIAVNYNAITGRLDLWDSESGLTSTATRAAGDFSSGQGFFLGGSVNPDQFMKGLIGEVKIYRGSMTPSEFTAERSALVTKWIGGSGSGFTSWITQTFVNGTIPEGQRGPNDDPDNDGIPNLVEYAIAGQDPTVSNPTIGTFTGTSLSFAKRLDATDITYAIEGSTDLGINDDWDEVSGPNYVNDPNTISYSFTQGTPPKNFLRLQVVD